MDNTQITVADLSLLKNIIDLASTRGAFQAGEMRQVGEVYEKLVAFLEAVVSQATSQEAVPPEAGETKGE
jgi:hypothetical protein